VRKHLMRFGSSEKEASEMASWEAGFFSLHSQSPSYELTKPFTDKSEFKALISCMGMYSEQLTDIELPASTWDDETDPPDAEFDIDFPESEIDY